MDHKSERSRMVREQLEDRGISDPLVLSSMSVVPRHKFVSDGLADVAYHDSPQSIGYGQTISQPYIVALMTEALELKGGEHVLEIGSGSGYAAAVLANIAESVVTLECIGPLATKAEKSLHELHFVNVLLIQADGSEGYPEQAPYDAIVVTAGGPEIPYALLEQLKPGGRLVMPLGPGADTQELVKVKKLDQGDYTTEILGPVRFVPLVGAAGWPEPTPRVLH